MAPGAGDLDARFDRELAAAARALVTEDLPRGVLDAGLAPAGSFGVVRGRRSLPALAGVTAVLVLLLATAIALAPAGIPPASPAPTPSPSATSAATPSATPAVRGAFRSTLDMRADFVRLRYTCHAGGVVLPVGPSPSAVVREGLVCNAPADDGPYIAAVIVGEAADGAVVEVHAKADLTQPDSPAGREAIAVPMAKAAAIAASGQGVGNQLAAWVIDTVPTIEPSKGAGTQLLGFSLKIVRSASGGYELFVHLL
jgi:hypothetical protein